MSKMYILVRESVSRGIASTAIAHASLACYLKYQHDPEMQDWLNKSFKKVICVATDRDIAKAKMQCDRYQVMTESSLGDEETCVVFSPRKEWPKMFKHLRLYG